MDPDMDSEHQLDQIASDVASIKRALVGEPLEGNMGLLHRMGKVERDMTWMKWLLPIFVTGGTALGQWLIRIWS